jgi:hypothetical protein
MAFGEWGGKVNIEKEMSVVTKALREDKDYYYAWQANIARHLAGEKGRNE